MDCAAARAINIEFGPEFDKRGYVYYNLLKNACNIVTYVCICMYVYVFLSPRTFIFYKCQRAFIKL